MLNNNIQAKAIENSELDSHSVEEEQGSVASASTDSQQANEDNSYSLPKLKELYQKEEIQRKNLNRQVEVLIAPVTTTQWFSNWVITDPTALTACLVVLIKEYPISHFSRLKIHIVSEKLNGVQNMQELFDEFVLPTLHNDFQIKCYSTIWNMIIDACDIFLVDEEFLLKVEESTDFIIDFKLTGSDSLSELIGGANA